MTAVIDVSSPIGTDHQADRARRRDRSAEYRRAEAALAPYEELARLVLRVRIDRGLSQEHLAKLMGTSASAVSRLESGQHRPNLQTLERLGEAIGMRLVIGFETEAGVPELVRG